MLFRSCFPAQYLIENKKNAQCNNRNYIISPFSPYKQRKSNYDNAKNGRLIKCHKPYALIFSLSIFSSGILSFISFLIITKGYRYSTSIVKQLKIFFHLIRKLEPHNQRQGNKHKSIQDRNMTSHFNSLINPF